MRDNNLEIFRRLDEDVFCFSMGFSSLMFYSCSYAWNRCLFSIEVKALLVTAPGKDPPFGSCFKRSPRQFVNDDP